VRRRGQLRHGERLRVLRCRVPLAEVRRCRGHRGRRRQRLLLLLLLLLRRRRRRRLLERLDELLPLDGGRVRVRVGLGLGLPD
jgi:hypothetical protein